MGFWSFSWKTLNDRGWYFHSRWGWCQTSWTWGWQSSCCSLHGSYHLHQQGSSCRWGAWGPAGPTGPGPPPGLPPPTSGGTGAAISNTQCSSRSNLTLLVNNWLIDTQLSTAYASIRVTCVLLWAYGLQATVVTCYSDSG